MKCKRCGHVSETDWNCRDLSLGLPGRVQNPGIKDLLRHNMRLDKVEVVSDYKCDGCKKNVKADLTMRILEQPRNLVLVLFHIYLQCESLSLFYVQFSFSLV